MTTVAGQEATHPDSSPDPTPGHRGSRLALAVAIAVALVAASAAFVVLRSDEPAPRVATTSPTTQLGPRHTMAVLPTPTTAAAASLFYVAIGNGPGELGFEGGQESDFTGPEGLALDPNRQVLYVLDDVNDRVIAFSIRDRIATGHFPVPGLIHSDIAVEPGSGDVLVVGAGHNSPGDEATRIYRFTPNGELRSNFAVGAASPVDPLYTLPAGLPRSGVYLSPGYLSGAPILDSALGAAVAPGLPLGTEDTLLPRVVDRRIDIEHVRSGVVQALVTIQPEGRQVLSISLLFDDDGPVLLVHSLEDAAPENPGTSLYQLDAELRVRQVINLPPYRTCGYMPEVVLDPSGPGAYGCRVVDGWKGFDFYRLDWVRA
jgi:hypothetical protein